MTRALLLGRFLRGLLSCRFCSCCQQQPGVAPSVQLQAWDGLVLQAHASCGSGGKSLLMGVLKCCETLLHTLPMLKGSQWPVQHGASPGMSNLSRPMQAWPPRPSASLCWEHPCVTAVAVYFPPFLAHFVFAESLAVARRGEAFLPQLPVPAVVAADRLPCPPVALMPQ